MDTPSRVSYLYLYSWHCIEKRIVTKVPSGGLPDVGSPCLLGTFPLHGVLIELSNQCHTSARFDLYSFDIPNRPEDETGLFNAVGQINDLINAEIESGIPPHRIVVGGLSQGAALAILTGLTTERKLAGVFVLSGYIPLRAKAETVRIFCFNLPSSHFRINCAICVQICKPLFPSIPLFFAHGTADRQVNYQFARDAAETFASQLQLPFYLSELSLSKTALLESNLTGLRFHSYQGMGHTISEMELEDLRLWIAAVLPRQGSSGICVVF
jgi:predicted esterase